MDFMPTCLADPVVNSSAHCIRSKPALPCVVGLISQELAATKWAKDQDGFISALTLAAAFAKSPVREALLGMPHVLPELPVPAETLRAVRGLRVIVILGLGEPWFWSPAARQLGYGWNPGTHSYAATVLLQFKAWQTAHACLQQGAHACCALVSLIHAYHQATEDSELPVLSVLSAFVAGCRREMRPPLGLMLQVQCQG